MTSVDERLLPMIDEARGRCHSCAHHEAHSIPIVGNVFACRAFGRQMTEQDRDTTRDCPRWAPWRPPDGFGRRSRITRNPLVAAIVNAEDQMFWMLSQHLREMGVDLKTLMICCQPSITSVHDVRWIDTLDARFDAEPVMPFDQLVEELRALHYDRLCTTLDELRARLVGPRADEPAAA